MVTDKVQMLLRWDSPSAKTKIPPLLTHGSIDPALRAAVDYSLLPVTQDKELTIEEWVATPYSDGLIQLRGIPQDDAVAVQQLFSTILIISFDSLTIDETVLTVTAAHQEVAEEFSRNDLFTLASEIGIEL